MASNLYCSVEVIEEMIWIERILLASDGTFLVNYWASSPFSGLVIHVLQSDFEQLLSYRMIFSIFHPVSFLIHLRSSSNNGLHVLHIMAFYFVSLARSPIRLQTYTNRQRSFLLLTVREFGKYFIELTTTLKKQ